MDFSLTTDEGVVYGTLDLIYREAQGGFEIVPNKYDFETGAENGHPWDKEFGRNIGTKMGRLFNGAGKTYTINFRGIAKPQRNSIFDHGGAPRITPY